MKLISESANIQSFGLWSAALVTGLMAVGYARLFRGIEEIFGSLLGEHPLQAIALTPPAFLLSWWLVYKLAPEASGSGIPQVMAAADLNADPSKKELVNRLLSVRTAGVKVLSSLICLIGGGAIGREGPTLQVSAVVFRFFGKHVRRYVPSTDEQTWIIAGAAAGLASAFNTPLGGIVYAIEEMAISHFHKIRTALISAVIISGIVAQTILGSYLYLGYPHLQPMHLAVWPYILLTGLVSGLAGAAFSWILLRALQWRLRMSSVYSLAAFTFACAVGVALLNYLTRSAYGPGSHLISQILFENQFASWGTTVSRFIATVLSYLAGGAGGIFSPSLTIGACIGSKVAYLFGSANVNLLAMIGMIGFLTGVTHTPFTSFILVLEMSDRHSAIFPMMVGALVANGVAKSVQSRSFYESVKEKWTEGR
jgi:H+/Cl- antiporter ClcA